MKLIEALGHPVFQHLRELTASTGIRAYVIGGFVRDHLLNRPCKDVDIVVEGRGIELAKAFAEKVGANDIVTYERFGTAMVHFQDYIVEFVGARKESYNHDSRNPIVEEGSLHDDQLRRDFTINAMSISLNEVDFGLLVDPFDGVGDLQRGWIQTPLDPDVTFSDDPLRMMRAVRFATQLNFHIQTKTYEAIARNKDRIKIISQERITDEMNKIILAPKPSKGFKMLFSTGVLHHIFPEMVDLYGVDIIDGRGHKDNFFHTLKVLDNLCQMSDDLWLRWSAILHDIAKPATKRYDKRVGWTFHGHEDRGARMVPRIFKKLRLPLDHKMKFVQKMVRLHLRPIALVDDIVTDSALRRLIVDAGEDLYQLLLLCRADITTRDERKMHRYLDNFDKVEEKIEEVMERDELRNWQPPVDGEMIMKEFDLRPCRMVGDIKSAVREAILEGEIPNDKAKAFDYMKKIGLELIQKSKDSHDVKPKK